MQLCFFSDQKSSNFLPLTLTRPSDDLRVGVFTIRQKWEAYLKPDSVSRNSEAHISKVFPSDEINPEQPCIWINSRALPNYELVKKIQVLNTNDRIVFNNDLIATKLNGVDSIDVLTTSLFPEPNETINITEIDTQLIQYLGDLLALNGSQIDSDLKFLKTPPLHQSKFATSCVSANPEKIFIEEDAIIEPGCILIANQGPIYIGAKARIEAGAILKGPVAVCEEATIKMGARISDSTTIGPVCKVGGEVMNSIFHSYSNKAHDGFMGNSIIGQWCNFGADTNTSNLKNNYSFITLPHWETGEYHTTGQFFGSAFGDHSKTSINTMLNTGTVCGVSANIFTSGFPPKMIRSFQWIGDNIHEPYKFDKALEGMQAMAKRRNVDFSDAYIAMMKHIYDSEHTPGG
ncbi:MAG: hypothetical protein MI700_10670 [Balneolales bacterium]|nr:hypothetical protein [Balneolales bacterium]